MARKDRKTLKLDPDNLPSDDELDALQAEINQALDDAADNILEEGAKADEESAEAKLAALELEMANLKDQALRAMAEAENVKKRAEREVAAARMYGVERFATDILSIVDNLGRALLTLDGKAKEDMGDNAKNLLEGIELTEKELYAILARHGIKAVPGKGSRFDPNVHQAVAQIPSDEEKGHVAEVMQVGFTIGDRTLRAAMVAVSTGKA
ncbi:MAG: nucleotide exchange factor GrpE [Hellea sp.]|nr:nucleotide exchange factor GrpE [Hellea sp.]